MYSRNYIHRSNLVGTGILAFLAGAAAWALFGRKVRDKVNESPQFQDLKNEVYDKASQMKDITQDQYNKLVDEVSGKYAQAKGISQNELRDLVSDLKWHWRRISSAWNEDRY
jgi:hypothetical protein